MIAVRREDAKHWPCPWVVYRKPTEPFAMSSCPERWQLKRAVDWVKAHRTNESPFAVFDVRGFWQHQIWPKATAEGRAAR
jgi:hypothetical protein